MYNRIQRKTPFAAGKRLRISSASIRVHKRQVCVNLVTTIRLAQSYICMRDFILFFFELEICGAYVPNRERVYLMCLLAYSLCRCLEASTPENSYS